MAITFRIHFNTFSACSERMLDLAGYVPLLSTKSALMRANLALVQLVTSIATLILLYAARLYEHGSGKNYTELTQEWSILSQESFKNSWSNGVRACVEFVPLVNLLLIAYDMGKAKLRQQELLQLPKVINLKLHVPLLFQIHPNIKSFAAASVSKAGL